MKNLWILAAGETDNNSEPDVITGGSAGAEEATGTTTQDSQPTDPAATDETTKPGLPMNQLIMMGVIFVIMYLIIFRGPKKKQQKHTQMVKSLSKNDRIRTIGGIYGTVIDVKDNELTIKIDESTNTKMKVSPGAIAEVISDKQD